MEMRGNQRTIGFSNCERYFAKGTRGIHGVHAIPELKPGMPNDFLARLFVEYNSTSAQEAEAAAAEKDIYDTAMARGAEILSAVVDADSANAAIEPFKNIEHALTSEKELRAAWKKKIAELGLFYDKVLGKYTAAPAEPDAPAEEATS